MQQLIVTVVAISLTLISATMTILGYTSLYSHNSLIIAFLFIVLECCKATIFGVILVSGRTHHKTVLLVLASLLIVASFIGHLSYLSKSYYTNQVTIQGNTEVNESLKESVKSQLSGIDEQIRILNQEIQEGNAEVEQIRKRANDFSRADQRNWILQTNSKTIQSILEHNRELSQTIQALYQDKANIQKEYNANLTTITNNVTEMASRSVFRYTADILDMEQDRLANIINILLSLVIDTLALVLLWVAGEMWNKDKNKLNLIYKKGKGLSEVKPPLTKAENNITMENVRNFNFEGYTVDDIIRMPTSSVDELKNRVKTEDQLNWINLALTIKNHADITGKISNDTAHYKELK